jgi:hypothetical protein
MRSHDGDTANFKLLGLMAAGLSMALFALLAVLGTGGFPLTI